MALEAGTELGDGTCLGEGGVMLVTNSLQSMSCMSASKAAGAGMGLHFGPRSQVLLQSQAMLLGRARAHGHPLALPPSFPKVITTSCVPGTLHHPHLLVLKRCSRSLYFEGGTGQARPGGGMIRRAGSPSRHSRTTRIKQTDDTPPEGQEPHACCPTHSSPHRRVSS